MNEVEKSEQMYFDSGPESFLSEVGQILRIDRCDIRIYNSVPTGDRVSITFAGWIPDQQSYMRTTQYGRSYGECLRKIREAIRMETGK